MRAALYHGPGDVRIEQIPEPTPGPGQVKLRVPYNGICGSDLTEYFAGPMLIPVDAPHPVTGIRTPVVLGHEFGGYIVDPLDDASGLAPGQLVAVEPPVTCGRCTSCAAGYRNLCSNVALHGFNTGTGGMAEFAVVDRGAVHPLPESFTAEQAALIEPLAVSFHAVARAGVAPGDTVVVYGAGPIGIGALLTLRHQGNRVIVVEPSEIRRVQAQKLGADEVVDPVSLDTAAIIREMTSGVGAAASIDAAGVPASFESALLSTAPRGTLVIVAVYKQPVLDFPALTMFSEISVTGSTTYTREDFSAVIRAMAEGAYPLDGWVEVISLDDLVQRGFERLHNGDAVKILVRVSAA